jgi:hypothetical protein
MVLDVVTVAKGSVDAAEECMLASLFSLSANGLRVKF